MSKRDRSVEQVIPHITTMIDDWLVYVNNQSVPKTLFFFFCFFFSYIFAISFLCSLFLYMLSSIKNGFSFEYGARTNAFASTDQLRVHRR